VGAAEDAQRRRLDEAAIERGEGTRHGRIAQWSEEHLDVVLRPAGGVGREVSEQVARQALTPAAESSRTDERATIASRYQACGSPARSPGCSSTSNNFRPARWWEWRGVIP
jgi:hypothetical protein